ncbi:MAG: hypothetical protein GY838_16620 [bacterium]|nr:hypothetical protein [bacterium]
MPRVRCGLAVVLLILCSSPPAQAAFPELRGPYFGQPLPGATAEIFAPDVISVTGRYEYALGFSPDGQRFLLTVQDGEDVYLVESRIMDGAWTEPARVDLTGGTRADEMEAFFAPDGERVFFAPYDEGLDVRIWQVPVTEEGFGEAAPLAGPAADDPAFFPTCTADGMIYYTNLAQRGVYRARPDSSGHWQAEPAEVEFGGHCFITPDGRTMLLDARADDTLGKGDIYAAFSTADGGWTRPVNLGAGINSEYGESCPSLSSDGRFLFFSRYDEEGEVSQIYWADAMVVAEKRAEVLGDESLIVQRIVTDSMAWALTKDRALLESIIAHDEDYFSFHPDGLEGTRGYAQFEQGFRIWMDDRFETTITAVRDFRCTFSRSGDVAWFSTVVDDCYTWGGQPGCWKDTRWTGVLEKRDGDWVITQMHFSFAAEN